MSGILSFFTLFLAGFVNTAKGIIFSFLLSIDSVAYRLVAYSFKVFNILCTLNFNSLYGIVSPLIDRIQVVMIVFIVFQLGMALLKYLLNPDELQKDGTKLVKNIFIATALFVSYNFVFSVMNELSIALMGNSIGYRYTTIGEIFDLNDEDGNGKNDPGLIMRFIFGSEGVNNGEDKVGESIAVSLAGVFIKDVINGEETDESGYLYREILDENSGSVDFSRMERLGDYVANGNVKYTMIIGFVVCLFVVYSVFSASIQVGVRMFKLVILQMICPLVIVDVIKNGIGGKLKKFGEVYISVFIEAFVRMLTILIITVFVSKFLIRIDAFFPQLSSGEGIITKGIIMVIIVIAAYTFAGQIPKFIDDVLGTKMSSGKTGNFVGSVLGAGVGAIAGFAGGLTAGGLGGALAGVATGGFKGFGEGGKGNTVADLIKAGKGSYGAGSTKGEAIRNVGGLGHYAAGRMANMTGMGKLIDRDLADLDKQNTALDDFATAQGNAIKDLTLDKDNMEITYKDDSGNDVTENYSGYYTDAAKGVKLTDNRDNYAAEMIKYDNDVIQKQAELDVEMKKDNPNASAIASARANLQKATFNAKKRAERYYDYRKENLQNDDKVSQIDKDNVSAKQKAYNKSAKRGENDAINVKNEKKRIYQDQQRIKNTQQYKNVQNTKNPSK